jgi:pimeloyl-ACP methyl ester carboxylesterase
MAIAVLGLVAFAAGACASSADTAQTAATDPPATTPGTTTPPLPTLHFYKPATVLASGHPGDVLNLSPTTIDPAWHGVAQRMTFVSTTPAGDLVPVTGVVITPSTPPPPGGYPILVWAHGTVGIGDNCAPSRFQPFDLPAGDQFLDAGYLIVAPDYEGLGVDGETHPYLVGDASGNNVLDAARAGQHLGGGRQVAAFGWSQGGHAVLFARERARTYAPELDVVGVVAAAPVTNVGLFLLQGRTNPDIFPFTAEAILSWSEVYEEPHLDDLVVVADAEKVRLARDNSCTGDLMPTEPLDDYFRAEPQNFDLWRAGARLNSPTGGDVDIPVLVTHGDADPLVPVQGTIDYHDSLCIAGEHVMFIRNAAWGHTAAWAVPLQDIVSWIEARFAGQPAPTDCPGATP